ncbi:MAG: hypothetical protein V1927_03185 [Candidatus Omnitrophota bacterium]
MNNGEPDKLTRYLNLEKFKDMCVSGLFLANATLFEDKQEGHAAIKSTFPDIKRSDLKNIEIMKSYFYISCWCAGAGYCDKMAVKHGKICIETSLAIVA